jgi:hypothetical protein
LLISFSFFSPFRFLKVCVNRYAIFPFRRVIIPCQNDGTLAKGTGEVTHAVIGTPAYTVAFSRKNQCLLSFFYCKADVSTRRLAPLGHLPIYGCAVIVGSIAPEKNTVNECVSMLAKRNKPTAFPM